MQREHFQSRLGFILVSAGCAIGIGNVWKFPYVTGQSGGGVFVILYLLFLLVLGAPVLTMELAIGRAFGKTVVGAYRTLEKPGNWWHIHGWVAIAGCYLLMMYYTTVAGWMLDYFVKFLTGTFEGLSTAQVDAVFTGMQASLPETMGYMALTVFGGFLVCSFGLQKGLERVSRVMMTGLLLLIFVLAGHSLTLQGAREGLRFYLYPNLSRIRDLGLGNVVVAAMNQAFFTLSIGVGSMEIFGSCMAKDKRLLGESLWICGLDTLVAMCSGLIIFPACFSFGVEPDSGPSLIFLTLPRVFVNMSGGRIWGALFFLFMSFASFSTVIAVFENLIACSMDNFGWTRRRSVIVNGMAMFVLSIPCVLGFNAWSGLRLIGNRDVMNTEDYVLSNLLLPVGALVFLLFCSTRWGWGFDNYRAECNTGRGLSVPEGWKYYFRYVLPIMILVVLIMGL